MYFITTKRMLEVCFFQHTPTFIIEPFFTLYSSFLSILILLYVRRTASVRTTISYKRP